MATHGLDKAVITALEIIDGAFVPVAPGPGVPTGPAIGLELIQRAKNKIKNKD